MIITSILNFAASKPKLRHLARITHMLLFANHMNQICHKFGTYLNNVSRFYQDVIIAFNTAYTVDENDFKEGIMEQCI